MLSFFSLKASSTIPMVAVLYVIIGMPRVTYSSTTSGDACGDSSLTRSVDACGLRFLFLVLECVFICLNCRWKQCRQSFSICLLWSHILRVKHALRPPYQKCLRKLLKRACACTCVRVCACVQACVGVRVCRCMYVCVRVRVRVRVRMHACKSHEYVCISVCVWFCFHYKMIKICLTAFSLLWKISQHKTWNNFFFMNTWQDKGSLRCCYTSICT